MRSSRLKEMSREDLIMYRLQRSKETIEEVKKLLEMKFYSTALNRVYYACFYGVLALLLSKGMKPTTHAGARQLLFLHFVRTGLISQELGTAYSQIFQHRQRADYDDFIYITKEEVEELLPYAEAFLSRIYELTK